MLKQRIVVVGGSSGAIDGLRQIVAGLDDDFPVPLCVVVHTSPDAPGILAKMLDRCGRLRAITAHDGMRLAPGTVYVAPPDFHLLIEPGVLRTTKGPRENRFRPAIDPLFRSAAQVYGPGAIGVLLSGSLDDGTAGLWAIKRLGGIAIVQDPTEALFPSMPASALNSVDVDHCVRLKELPGLLTGLVRAPVHAELPIAEPRTLEVEVKIAKATNAVDAGVEEIGEPSPFACPECHGVLLKLKDSHPLRFRCHTGHAYAADSLVAAVSDGIEEALWTSVRAMEEGAILLSHLAGHLDGSADGTELQELRRQADELRSDGQ